VGSSATYKIQHVNNQWQILYNGTEVGYFPASIWTSRNVSYTSVGRVEIFGEAIQPRATVGKMQIGNGILGGSPGAAWVHNYSLIGANTAQHLDSMQYSKPTIYNVSGISTTGFSYGGPGIF
jgi:hypothetical protein